MGKRISRQAGGSRETGQTSPPVDSVRTAELIESCRAHAASLVELAGGTAKALYECYEYEDNEPHLGHCCDLVRQILEQSQSALALLGVVAHDLDPRLRAEEAARGCESQCQSLTQAMHVVRATSSILGRLETNHHDYILLSLHDLESGIAAVVAGLQVAVQPSCVGGS
jgi:hypothetical protein